MGNIGATEIILILIIALVVFGPRRLPEIGRTVGKSLREFRKASRDLRDEFQFSLDDDDEPPVSHSKPRAESDRPPEPTATAPEGETQVAEAKPSVAGAKPRAARAKASAQTRARRPGAGTARKPERPA